MSIVRWRSNPGLGALRTWLRARGGGTPALLGLNPGLATQASRCPLWASVFPLQNGIRSHFIYFCLMSKTLCQSSVCPTWTRQALHRHVLSGLPGPSLELGPRVVMQGGNRAQGGLGAAPGPSSQDSQLHPSGGAPSWPGHLTRWRPRGSCGLCRLIPTEIEAGPGVSRLRPPSHCRKPHLRIYLSPGRLIFNLGSDSACLGLQESTLF